MDMQNAGLEFQKFSRTVPRERSNFVLPDNPELTSGIDRPPACQSRALAAPLLLFAMAAMNWCPVHAHDHAPAAQVSAPDIRPAREMQAIQDFEFLPSQTAIRVVGERGESGEVVDRAGGGRAGSADRVGDTRQPPQQILQTLAATKPQADQADPDNERVETRVRALTMSLRAELASVQAAAEAAVAEQKKIAEQERQRAEELKHDLDALRVDAYLEAVEAVNKDEAQRGTVEREKSKVERLTREVSSLQTELERIQTARAQAAPLIKEDVEKRQAVEQQLKQQRDRADEFSRETATLKAELNAAREAGEKAARTTNAGKADIEQQLGRRRIENGRLAGDLESARKAGERQSSDLAAARAEGEKTAGAAKAAAAEQERALKAVRDRADRAESELAAIRDTIAQEAQRAGTMEALTSQYAEPKAPDPIREPPPLASKAPEPVVRTTPRETVGDASLTVASSAPRSELERVPTVPEKPAAAEQPQTERLAMTPPLTQPAVAAPFDDTRLLARAAALLQQADISTARPVLEYAFQRGSARAAFLLAETYDARILRTWKVHGIAGDPTKARELYQRALDGGIEDAGIRIAGLK